MFKTIDQHEHVFHKDLVDPFLKELKSCGSALFDTFPDHQKASFILAKENPNKINGGAILVKRKEESLHPLLRERLDSFIPPHQEVWVGSVLLKLTPRLSGQDFECFSKIFYRKLYESLVEFGRQERIAFLCLTLAVCEYKTTDLIENWPYALTIRPKESGDGFFHTILALRGRRNETSCFWKSLSALTKIKDLTV